MSIGYVDPISKKYVKKAGDLNLLNVPEASESSNGLMSASDKKKLDSLVPNTDIADTSTIKDLFKKGV